MFIFHWFGDVWQIGDDSDFFAMIFIKLLLFGIVLAIAAVVLVPWLGFKMIQWKPVVGIPLVVGLVILGGAAIASGA